MSKRTTPIHKNWQFKQTNSTNPFLPVSQFPTNIHLDLLHHNLIPDPFFAKEELSVQWVGEEKWTYRTTFGTPRGRGSKGGERDVLVFDGLDTYATVALNGKEVLKGDNMFLAYRVDVTELLKDGYGDDTGENELEIKFDSAFLVGKKIVDEWGEHHWGCWNGDESRLAVRKAQYHYGWDWGPTLLTCGPWRPISLESYTSRITDLYFTTDVPFALRDVVISAAAGIEGPCSAVVFTITSPSGETLFPTSASISTYKSGNGALAEAKFEIADPELWFPHGYGGQPLYRLNAALGDGVDKSSKTLGIRRVKLVQRALEEQGGLSFFFEINNVPIFCGGSNWIPADSFIPRISDEKYIQWLELLVAGLQVMVRVWAGGIYEQPIFYETCDKLGILVWQDFAFGCGNYPAQIPGFRESVRKEAIDNVKKLRHHPSIVIYAGNNEDYQYMESIPGGLGYDKDDHNPENWLKTGFPARYIYEKILPEVVAEHGCGTIYRPGSPYSTGGGDTRDATFGDIHQWNVWHGTQEKYQSFDRLSGRFVSEFGMQAFPSPLTIDSYLPPNSPDRYSQSSTIDFHNKASGHEGRLALYLVENIRYCFSPLEQYIYSTQLMQAECLSTAFRLWRREWKGPGKEYVAGALVWQMNDCWPVTSWAVVDYHLRPKHAYFAIKRELEPYTIGIKRARVEKKRDGHTRVYIDVEERIHVWIGTFNTCALRGAKVVVKAWDMGGRKLAQEMLCEDITLEGNRSMEVADVRLPGWSGVLEGERNVVVAAYLIDKDGTTLARRVSWAEPLKYVKFQHPKHLSASVSTGRVTLSAEVPIKGVAVETHKQGVVFEDNLVDLVPGETVAIVVKGLGVGDEVGVRYLL